MLNALFFFSNPISEVSYLFAEMVQHGLRCIAFCRSRKLTEIVLSYYTREILQKTAPYLVGSICAYRSSYVVEDRRQLERDIFSGKLSGIAATNAPELGIDVGHIDAALHLGFPGSVASSWQQAGRSGRRERPSLAVLKQHLVCAALEHPLSLLHDEKYFGSSLGNALMSLKNKGDLSFDPSRDSSARIWSYIGHEIYEGAVYMHQGKTNMVKELDISEKIALCYEANLHYYTKTRDYTDIDVLGGDILC
ncbi:hypothetical protein NC652_029517 [Populus alba x Populus x berolinensis]|nr:hypothetical protein NC652_029517 [Populus alba x Populus x berolinensis]